MGFNWWYGDTDSKPRQTTSIPRQPTIHLKNQKKKKRSKTPFHARAEKCAWELYDKKNRRAGQGTALFCTVMARLAENEASSRKKTRKNMLKGSSSRPPINLWINQNNLNLEKTEQKNSENKKTKPSRKQQTKQNTKSKENKTKQKDKQKKTKQNTETNKQKQFSMGFPGGPCFLESLEYIMYFEFVLLLFRCVFVFFSRLFCCPFFEGAPPRPSAIWELTFIFAQFLFFFVHSRIFWDFPQFVGQ